MEGFVQDLRYGFRALRARPGFTVVAVLTLALGIAVNTTMFGVVSGVLLAELPYRDPERLVLFRVMTDGQTSPPSLAPLKSRRSASARPCSRTSHRYETTPPP